MKISIQAEKINVSNTLTERKDFRFYFSGQHTKSQLQNKTSVLTCSMIEITVVNQTQNHEKKASLNSIVFRIDVNTSMSGVDV